MASSFYQPAAPLGGLSLSIFLHGFRGSHEQWWTDNLHENISQNKSIQETSRESGGFIIIYMKITCIDGTFILEISVINYWGDIIQLKSWRGSSNTNLPLNAFKWIVVSFACYYSRSEYLKSWWKLQSSIQVRYQSRKIAAWILRIVAWEIIYISTYKTKYCVFPSILLNLTV